MKRLLWKEWRERWLWFVLWFVAVLGTAALGEGQQFCGSGSTPLSSWIVLPAGLAALAGLRGYNSELQGNRATFLYSRAQLWGRLLAAKALPGLGVAVVAAALGALVCRVTAPAAYLPFVTPAHLAQGALEMAGITGGLYLLGLSCSIVLSGLAGSIIALLLWFGLVFLSGQTVAIVFHGGYVRMFVFALCAAPVVALAVIARFGLTLSWEQRLKRFVLILVLVSLTGGLLNAIPYVRTFVSGVTGEAEEEQPVGYLSPRGSNAIYDGNLRRRYVTVWINLASGRQQALNKHADVWMSASHWLSDDCLLLQTNENDNPFHLGCWRDGKVTLTRIPTKEINARALYFSPDGTRLLWEDWPQLKLINPQTGVITVIAKLPPARAERRDGMMNRCWWQDNRTVGYTEPEVKQMHFAAAP
ncbi:MAG TPA: hypothetical protein VGL77_21725 [Armatimonadota bacterium]|jgi:hypothetical protein